MWAKPILSMSICWERSTSLLTVSHTDTNCQLLVSTWRRYPSGNRSALKWGDQLSWETHITINHGNPEHIYLFGDTTRDGMMDRRGTALESFSSPALGFKAVTGSYEALSKIFKNKIQWHKGRRDGLLSYMYFHILRRVVHDGHRHSHFE